MTATDIVSILQVGFSGFAFLMAGLSFRLLREEVRKDGPGRRLILSAVQRYVNYTIALAILVAASRFGEGWYKSHLASEARREMISSEDARNCRDSLDQLAKADAQVATSNEDLRRAIAIDSAACQPLLRSLGHSE